MDLQYVCLEVTKNCNNFCKHCYNFWAEGRNQLSKNEVSLTRQEIRQIIKKIKKDINLKYVAVSGGEPLLRSDLPLIINDLFEENIVPVIITNGLLLNESLLKSFPKNIHFEISLLSNKAQIHNSLAGNNVFDTVIKNISKINRYGHVFSTVFVATKYNALDVYKTIELGMALGSGAFMFNRINISAGMKPYLEELVPSSDMLTKSLEQLQNAVIKYKINTVCSVPIPPCIVDISQFPDVNFGWCPRGGDNSYYTIGHTGLLRACNHSSIILGDLKKERFLDIISKQKVISFWQTIPKECKNCEHELKDKCLGGCTAASFEYYGSQEYIDPICKLIK
jgi:radical SAM protein with 4Fe4S-binding SPASM domain